MNMLENFLNIQPKQHLLLLFFYELYPIYCKVLVGSNMIYMLSTGTQCSYYPPKLCAKKANLKFEYEFITIDNNSNMFEQVPFREFSFSM